MIDTQLEDHFRKLGHANNAERRWYYYGTDIPDKKDAPVAAFGRMSLSASPTKPVPPRSRAELQQDQDEEEAARFRRSLEDSV